MIIKYLYNPISNFTNDEKKVFLENMTRAITLNKESDIVDLLNNFGDQIVKLKNRSRELFVDSEFSNEKPSIGEPHSAKSYKGIMLAVMLKYFNTEKTISEDNIGDRFFLEFCKKIELVNFFKQNVTIEYENNKLTYHRCHYYLSEEYKPNKEDIKYIKDIIKISCLEEIKLDKKSIDYLEEIKLNNSLDIVKIICKYIRLEKECSKIHEKLLRKIKKIIDIESKIHSLNTEYKKNIHSLLTDFFYNSDEAQQQLSALLDEPKTAIDLQSANELTPPLKNLAL
jgi:hypothetical protein